MDTVEAFVPEPVNKPLLKKNTKTDSFLISDFKKIKEISGLISFKSVVFRLS